MQERTPDQIYAELFEAVQSSQVLDDSKTFVDATPRSEPAGILKLYREECQAPGFDLRAFLTANFEFPEAFDKPLQAHPDRPLREHIEALWDLLTRVADTEKENSSLIALLHPYVVPGGRFRELYYWDSYFTMLGLASSGRIELIENMVANFAFLIDQIGFIPNGNRTYYCSRTQPPFFSLMVELLAEVKNDRSVYSRFLSQLQKEYEFWMAGLDALNDQRPAVRRVVLVDGGYLNRYWDDSDQPRPESYVEDLQLATQSSRNPSELFRNVRAACESGWDFSSRWLEDGKTLATIRTTQIVPVDLNSALWKLESVLSLASQIAGNMRQAKFFQKRAEQRKGLIQSLFFDTQSGFFKDLVLPDLGFNSSLSLAAAFPLFFNLATPTQGRPVAVRINQDFLCAGGWVTTLFKSGQQWDAPNGWAPLQWIVYVGLENYGFSAAAAEGAKRWVENNQQAYQRSGKLLEKYNVEVVDSTARGGEYDVQDGFGWTNGVLLGFMDKLGMV